tara:strand:+ start:3632 stop:6454 length:2823 start_codon:yes stop_codon:yes gene_type:complete
MFKSKHIGSIDHIKEILSSLGFKTLDLFIDNIIPEAIKSKTKIETPKAITEQKMLERLSRLSKENKINKSFIGMGYYGTIIPSVIKRNILENPGWYTQYTPYQAEISQGRLEALFNYQTLVCDLTSLPISNASLLDESTAAAEAMIMFYNMTSQSQKNCFLVSNRCHPQTIDVIITRSEPLGIKIEIIDPQKIKFHDSIFGVLLQNPDTEGELKDFSSICKIAKENKSFVCIATDLLALTKIKSPGEMGADAAIGSSQRFGVPMGYGGPHAAFFATTKKFKRKIPGRIIGLSKDKHGNPAYRMALQTREQHIRREKATSNICTSQALLAIISGMYGIYHGKSGLVQIANRINKLTYQLADSLINSGVFVKHKCFFDTICIKADKWEKEAHLLNINFRKFNDNTIGVSLDETSTEEDIKKIASIFEAKILGKKTNSIPEGYLRKSSFLDHPTFKNYQTETKLMRYMHKLESRDLSLNSSMIPLGSCTMKLNSASEMEALTWPEFGELHPFCPIDQAKGYNKIITELGYWLTNITGFDNISFQPNSGAQGEYAGLLLIRAYHKANGNSNRNICLIPSSAHGTNPASAVMAGMKVVIIKCDKYGNISEEDLNDKVKEHSENISALMVTYPSTHGVFENSIKDICQLIHDHGGQIYMDGANLNALVGLCKPGEFGCDVMHINLHKTFCIPHGGGGPGMGPIVCKEHLSGYLPNHFHTKKDHETTINTVSASPYGSSSILTISWAYISMMGPDGLKEASQVAILNANYMAKKIENHFPILYRGITGFCAHEFIIDIRPLRQNSGISEEDIAKRLMDYGFHAPTMSWPVPGTMMIEPTESESKDELDRFCEAIICIKNEIELIIKNNISIKHSILKNAPHTALELSSNKWSYPYSRKEAAYPAPWLHDYKYWPSVGRIDNTFGDRNLVCACIAIEEFKEDKDKPKD